MPAAKPDSELSSVEPLMRAGDFAAALSSLMARPKQDVETLYLIAVCLRYQKNFDGALETLQQLHRLSPDHSRALQEEGHVFRAKQDWNHALAAYSRATQLNPALAASWQAQFEILRMQQRAPEANMILERIERLQQLPKILVSATDLVAQGKLVKAEQVCRAFLHKNPLNVEAMRLLADIGLKLGVLEDAEFLLSTAADLAPDDPQIQMELLQVLRKRQKFNASLACAKRLLEKAPNNPQFQSLYAIECMQTGDYQKALALFDTVLTALPGEPITLTSRGHALKTDGQQSAAIDSYTRALASKRSHGEAWYSLANLKTFTFSAQQITEMQSLVEQAYLSHNDRVYLNFALGKALEDQAQYHDSFAHYQAGNDLKKAQSRYLASKMKEEFDLQRKHCNAEFVSRISGAGDPSPAPIFIVGLPRAGSTLLEQILSSHSQVDGTLELPNIPALAHRLRRGPREQITASNQYPEVLHRLTKQELAEYGATYLRDTQIHRQDAPFFIDKMPNNFRHIGLIKAILPNAKIIDARRHPMACCFSGYKQLFAEGQEFTYDLTDIGRYYRDYVELMAHWQSVLPEQILQVNYEDVVDDLETQVSRILDYCGLPHESACIDFHRTKRAVRTPSSEQVRQPLFRSGLEQWRHYDAWLSPLRDALGDLPTTCDLPTT
ncbi:tetratricopeptide repeat-containing sulfotransferase family protein [Arenicella xantha]|uniref:Tetratricopeptide repeat protein n=1 Tax=Arenicella xantha TaxID=644221 RepID=A0A395JJS6_9GAMM|nr:tetratricopeptide repeat-containing sulfotransferase family protein [Arenicella xantha]RBP50665.1 tetratricopeptide repeat protein [Arenicella xantha]